MTPRRSTAAPILAALAIVLVLLGAYVGGYFWLSEIDPTATFIRADGTEQPGQVRYFQHSGLVMLFHPASAVESWLTGRMTVNCLPD